MILLSPVSEAPLMEEASCRVCGEKVAIHCIEIVSTDEDLNKLLSGRLNTIDCPTCGSPVTSETAVEVNIPKLGIGTLFYTPFWYLDMEFVSKGFVEADGQNLVFYSLDELASQVKARIKFRNIQEHQRQTRTSS